jgi:hypothetical protein
VSNLLDLCTANSTTRLGPCAEVRVGEHVMRYVRRGSGPSVVVAGADSQASPVWAPLVEQLVESHRVVVPEPPPEGTDVSSWLRGFIEGIGLTSIVLIAGGVASAASLELATTDDFTVRRLVLLPTAGERRNGISGDGANGESRPEGQSAVDRTLWVLPEWSTPDSLRRIQSFIGA